MDSSTADQADSSSSASGDSVQDDSGDENGNPNGTELPSIVVPNGVDEASDTASSSNSDVARLQPAPSPSPSRPSRSLTSSIPSFNVSKGIRFGRHSSPGTGAPLKPLQAVSPHFSLMPATLYLSIRLPGAHTVWRFSADSRKAGENVILLSSFVFGIQRLWPATHHDIWIFIELATLLVLTVIYLIWTYLSYFSLPKLPPFQPRSRRTGRSASPRVDPRDSRKLHSTSVPPPRLDDFGYVWMTVPKNYRNSSDDGVLTALLLGPLIAIAFLYTSLQTLSSPITSANPLPSWWRVEPPAVLVKEVNQFTAIQALALSRRSMIDQSTFCSFILLMHLTTSRLVEAWLRASASTPESERVSVPRNEGRRTWLYVRFGVILTLMSLCLRRLFEVLDIGVWRDLSYLDVAVSSVFYQFTLYTAIRIAHHSLTLGELGLVVYGATLLFMEAFHLTIAKKWPMVTPYIATYRLPTPLLIFQHALIPGAIAIGFLLSPLLFLSRHIAQRPLRRLRLPEEKQVHLRALALGFYAGAALITGGMIGMWTRWCLGGRDPWMWVIFWLLEGRAKWTRPLLLVYWIVLVTLSIAGWNRRLSRSRKYRHLTALTPVTAAFEVTSNSTEANPPSSEFTSPSHALGLNFPSLPSLPNGSHMSSVATEFIDAAEQRMPPMTLNGRRKFYHALVVVMLLPGIAFDSAFTHLSTSVAFALFTFLEYIRYFALYPFGASVHVFLTEFIDHKDSGTAILSHFYLLTGCAGSLWLEGPSRLLEYTGLLALGVGDSLASISGRKWGRHLWSPTSSKTLEGTAAFVISVIACVWFLRILGVVEEFSTPRYTAAVCVTALLEALSVQNDNLTIPLFLWSILILSNV